MIAVDMQTVMVGDVIINLICLIVLIQLWHQTRGKYHGIMLWVINWTLQVGGILLIALRDTVPGWASIILANSIMSFGIMILYFGLSRFLGKKSSTAIKTFVLMIFIAFVFVHTYFTYVHDDLVVRDFNVSIGSAIACLLCMRLVFRESRPEIRRISKNTGISFSIILLISLIRIIGLVLMPQTNGFLQSGMFDTTLVLLLLGATAFLAFNLILMVNRRLYLETKKAEEEIKTLARFPSENPNPVLRVNRAGVILYANDGSRPILEKWGCLSGETLPENWQKLVADVFASGVEWETGVEHDNRTFLLTFIPASGTDYLNIFGRDITMHKQAEEALKKSEANYRILYETMTQGIVYQNADGKIISANSSAGNILGLTLEQMQGLTSMDHSWKSIHEDGSAFPGETHPSIVALKTGKAVKNVVMGVFNPQKEAYHWLNIDAVPEFHAGEKQPYQVYTVFTDITERKQVEKQSQELEVLKEVDRLRTELLANVSHELRTPLAVIKGFAATLLRRDVQWDDSQKQNFLETIDHESDHLTRLINDLLYMSRIDAGELRPDKKKIAVAGLINSLMPSLQTLTAKHKLAVVIADDLPPVFVDEMEIGQVMINLVENATKFSDPDTEIKIQARKTDHQVVISVIDHGIGIPSDQLDKIFSRFYQVGNAVKGKSKGTGLGLPICRGVIEGNGGKIWVESVVDKGSTFYFSLPVFVEKS